MDGFPLTNKNSVDQIDQEQADNIEFHVRAVVSVLPASSSSVDIYKVAQAEDTVCTALISYCTNG